MIASSQIKTYITDEKNINNDRIRDGTWGGCFLHTICFQIYIGHYAHRANVQDIYR
jgi:hypothetical protein